MPTGVYARTVEHRRKISLTKLGKPLKHGMSYSKEYSSYWHMLGRCSAKEGDKNYANYVKRGITVSPEWLMGFEQFIKDMGVMPKDGQRWTIERINNDLGYSKENCKWATYSEQALNQRHPKHKNPSKGAKHYYYSTKRDRWIVDSMWVGVRHKQFKTEQEAREFIISKRTKKES